MKVNTKDFVIRAKKYHGEQYDYSLSEYVNSSTKIKILCRIHGAFSALPGNHTQGSGCPTCGGVGRKTTADFINQASEVHDDKYGYSLTQYKNSHTKVKITCPEHGTFSQAPTDHLSGKGCRDCSGNVVKPVEVFIAQAGISHGDKYDYSLTQYKNSHTKVEIICPEHGVFTQIPTSHLRGTGCPSCAVRGFVPHNRSFVYVLMSQDGHVKIGVSNKPEERFRKLRRKTPFIFDVLGIFEVPGVNALQIEKLCHSQMTSAGLKGFEGATEWFRFEGQQLGGIQSFLTSVAPY